MKEPRLQDILPIVREAGEIILRREGADRIASKAAQDFVTDVDFKVQCFIRDRLAQDWPHIQFMGEEQDNSHLDFSRPYWVLDPIDGTTNYFRRRRCSMISIGAVQGKTPVFGLLYDPYRDELFQKVIDFVESKM